MPTPKTNRIKTAHRSHLEYHVNLAKRRNWYADEAGGEGGESADATKATDATKTDAKMSDDELQKFKDKIAGNLRKEAKASVFKDILTQLGADPNDEKAVENIKARLAKVQELEDASLTATQKLEKDLAAAQKERDEAKADRERILQEGRIKERDSAITEAFNAPAMNCQNPKKVMTLLKADHADKVEALLKADGSIDKDALAKLVELGKSENPEYFRGKGAGTGSHGVGGRGGEVDTRAEQRYSAMNQGRIKG